jgi:hypothetical protein
MEDDSGIPEVDSPLTDLRDVVDTPAVSRDSLLPAASVGTATGVAAITDDVGAVSDGVAREQSPEVRFDSDVGSVESGEVLDRLNTSPEVDSGEVAQLPAGQLQQEATVPAPQTRESLDLDVFEGGFASVEPGGSVDVRTESRLDIRQDTLTETLPREDTRPRIDVRTEQETATELRPEMRTETEQNLETRIDGRSEVRREVGFEIEPETRIESNADDRRERERDPQNGSESPAPLASEVGEFDFLSLSETDDRIEGVLGGGR